MHAYRILLPSETDDTRFNSRKKHMLTDSIIDLALFFCMDLAPSSLGPY
jgi:hypothetical protein